MRIRGRLTLSYLACGILPMLAVTAMCLVNSRNGGLEIRDKASEDLREKMTERCTAVRNTSAAEIVDYFQTIRDHVITMSEDISVVDAMRDFTAAAHGLAEERELDDEAIAAMRHDLVNYYENSFAPEYRAQNDGKNPSATSKLNIVSPSGVILQHQYIKSNSNPLGSKHILDASDEGTSYDKLHAKYHPFMRSFLERGGYYDIFLIDAKTGTVVYSVFKELDFGTNLKSGPYANSNFARVFNETLGKPVGEACLVDFECYYPSYEAPASFIGSPIYEGNEQIGSIVFQMPISRVNSLIARDAGLGKTSESMLVGSDMKQRCDSKRDPVACSLIDAFRLNKTDLMRTDSVRKAFSGETGVQTTTNYLGEEVISAYAPITVLGLNWAVTTEVTTAEAFASVADMEVLTSKVQSRMLWMSALALVVVAGFVVAVSYVIVRSIVHPIDATVETLRDIAEGEGDLTRRLDENQVGELGDLAKYFNQFVVRIHDIIGSISGNAGTLTVSSRQLSESATHLSAGATQSKSQSATVSSAAEELSINMQNMARSTEEMSGGINSVASAVDEMRQTISEIAENAERSADVAGQAAIAAEVSNDKVGGMGVAAEEIGKVIEVIQDIAEQTNLLALNATIEAARAGEAGKGFAVVATEVKQLAKQTATATDEIRTRIEAMQKSTGEAVTSIKEISDVIRRVNELSRVIASAVEEQNITTQQIAGHVSSTANLAQTVARGVAESAEASREITVNISQVDSVLLETASGADQSRASGDELLRLASEMQQLVSQFRLSRESVEV